MNQWSGRWVCASVSIHPSTATPRQADECRYNVERGRSSPNVAMDAAMHVESQHGRLSPDLSSALLIHAKIATPFSVPLAVVCATVHNLGAILALVRKYCDLVTRGRSLLVRPRPRAWK